MTGKNLISEIIKRIKELDKRISKEEENYHKEHDVDKKFNIYQRQQKCQSKKAAFLEVIDLANKI